jgi:RHS repeat-associated protein
VTGDVSNITIKDEWTGQGQAPPGYDYYYDVALYYTTHGKLWRVLWDKWLVDGQGQVILESYERLAAREFCYDSARQRYLDRDVDPETWELVGDGRWTDYLGEQAYGDFTHSGTSEEQPAEQVRYLPEFGVHGQHTLASEETRYLHGDLTRSTTLMTDEDAGASATLAYTAFGEAIGDASTLSTRYQYAGAWGYESGLVSLQGANEELAPIQLLHVGARWYDPGLARFLQRDPTGLSGGRNLYLYCGESPVQSVDPVGWWPQEMGPKWTEQNARRFLPVPKGITIGLTPEPISPGVVQQGGVDISFEDGSWTWFGMYGAGAKVWDLGALCFGLWGDTSGRNGPWFEIDAGPIWIMGGEDQGDGHWISGGVELGPVWVGPYWE